MKELVKSQGIIYKENLNRCGARLYETITLLEEYNKTKKWENVEKKALESNILNKKSSNTIKTILRCVKNRFRDVEGLPKFEELSSFVSSDIPDKAKIQVLLPYICKTDPLIHQYVLKLVCPNLHSKNKVELSKRIFHDFFEKESHEHQELTKWSENSEVRWVRSLLSILRKFGFMKPAPSLKLEKPQLRIETFTFYCLFLLLKCTSGKELVENGIWRLFALSTVETERFLENAQMKGWIHYSRSGDIVSINTEYKSLEGWINDLD
jgi:hypothetical protein